MRKFLYITVLLSSIITLLEAQGKGTLKRFVFKGKVVDQEVGFVYLSYIKDSIRIYDSVRIEKGRFTFCGFIERPTWAILSEKIKSHSVNDNYVELFLEPGIINVILKKDSFKEAKITGSATEDEWSMLMKKEAPILKEMYKNGYQNKYDSLKMQVRQIELKFILTHPNSYLTPFLFRKYLNSFSLDSVKYYYAKWAPFVKEGWDAKMVKGEILKKQSSQLGSIAPDFQAKDINDKNISLSSFKERSYVLLDFWASWCIPCRENIMHLKKMYSKYHSKGLDIILISEDINETAWKNAIQQDSINMCYNVRSAKNLLRAPTKDDIISKYYTNGIPIEYLINKKGIIIGKWDGQSDENDSDLDKKLNHIFNNE